jgi:two-component system, chemotaxis family, sensor kinase CheA
MTTATESSPDLIADFVDEALESLRPLSGMFATFRENPSDFAPIHAVFRAVHSIKGCAGFLGLLAVKQLAHALENTLDEVRKGKIALTNDLQRAFIRGFDALDVMLQRASEGNVDTELSDEDAALFEEVEAAASTIHAPADDESTLLEQLTALAEEIAGSTHPQAADWCQRVWTLAATIGGGEREAPDLAESEVVEERLTATSFLDAECRLGDADVTTAVRRLIALFVRAEEGVYDAELGRGFLESAQEFADLCRNADDPALADVVVQSAADFQVLLDSPLDVDPLLVSIVWDRLEPGLSTLLVEDAEDAAEVNASSTSTPRSLDASPRAADAGAKAKARVLRIREECVDEFLQSVSGLFLTGELYKDVQSRMSAVGVLTNLVEEFRQINNAFAVQSTALQRNVVALRQVAASGLMSKFPQMARSLATQLGKQIDVHLAGEETEIDKSLVEDLDAPLTHMIRNVVDHGIEPPEDRIAAGKPATGNLWIKAEQTKSHVHITIADDGRGINPGVLRAKAIEKGLLSPEQARAMSDQEAIELIFHAGFSTAKEVSDISGRGVGMDVVRTKIREHNGDIVVDSTVGQGTTFHLHIPVREAVVVIDGLLLRHAGAHYVLPFEHVLEIAEFGPSELNSVQGSRIASFRGQNYDAVSLGRLLDLPIESVEPTHGDKTIAVLVGCKQGSFCVLVDAVLGHRKVVVNSIKEMLPQADRMAGVAQLGGGRLALVLSAQDIFEARLKNARVGTHR